MGKKIGIIGLGNMGKNMAKNLLNGGYDLTVYDVRQEPIDEMVALGAKEAKNLPELGKVCDVIFCMVLNFAQVQAVTVSENGVISGMRSGSVLIITSTIAPAEVKSVAEYSMKTGVRVIDAPVSGGVKGSSAGTMTMMVACDDETWQECEGVLKCVGSNATKVGNQVGIGQVIKAANQLLVSVHIAAMAEAMVMATAAGADPVITAEIIKKSVGNSYMFEEKIPQILGRDFVNRGALDIQIKDLNICLKTGNEFNVPLPTAAASREMYILANGLGYGREDLCAIIKPLEQAAGIEVKPR